MCFLVCLGVCLSVFRCVFGCVCLECVIYAIFQVSVTIVDFLFCHLYNCRFLILSPKIFPRKFGQMCFCHFTRRIFVVRQ